VDDIVSIPRTDIVQTEFLTQAEVVVREVVENKNFDAGFQFINDLHAQGKAFDDAIGMMLNGMSEAWIPDEHDGEKFEQATLRKTGLAPVTVQRHLNIQKALPSVPDEYREEIQKMSFREKIQVANLIHGGYEITQENYRDLAEAIDDKDVRRIARKIKGVEPRSNWLSITMDEHGVLTVHTVRGHVEVGRLNTWDDNPDVQKAIARLTNCGVEPQREY
jgi:hypothetical protein